MYLQMVWFAHKTSMRCGNVLLTGDVTGKNVMATVKVFRQEKHYYYYNFKKHVVIPTFYVMKWKGQAHSTHVSFWL